MLAQVVHIAYTTTLLVVYIYIHHFANCQFSPSILNETSPEPLGLWSFTREVPKVTSFAEFHHSQEEQHFSILGHKPVKRCLHLTISVYITYMNNGLVYSAYIRRKLPLVLRSYICRIHDVTMIYILHNIRQYYKYNI